MSKKTPSRIIKRKCPICKADIVCEGQGEWREDLKAYEWYKSNHACYEVNEMAKTLGALGGLMTSKKHGTKHYSEAGKKGMLKRWGKKP